MSRDPEDTDIRQILSSTFVIGVVGLSAKPERASNRVAHYLSDHGYRVIGVNPGLAGRQMFGETVVASVSDLPAQTDMIDLFRKSDAVGPIVEAALAALPGLRTVWMQLGVENAEARLMAEARGLNVVENRCPKIEHARLLAAKQA